MAQIKDILVEKNPWWKEKFTVEFKEREIYKNMQKFLKLSQIVALTGLRRVGKTTIMYKIVEDSIKEGSDSKNIVYFSFDEFREADVREVLKAYEELTEKDFRKEKCVLLLDEIQKLNNWEDQLKSIYDSFKKTLKIVISGSESLFIRKKSKETLAGRVFEFKVEQLTFKEFLSFKGIGFKPTGLYGRELSKLLLEFIISIGFPELVNIEDKEVIKKYTKEGIIEKIIYKDIPSLFKVKDSAVLESLLNIIMENPGQIIEISELSKELGISRQVVSDYLSYLEDSFLIRKLYNFSKNRRKVERKLKKYYPSIVSADMLFRDDNHSRSMIFEWFIVNQMKAEFFWRDPYKHEVDIVLFDKTIIPIEIKYGKVEFDGILKFMENFNVKEGFIISKDKEETKDFEGKKISIIPAYKFLIEEYV